MQRVRLAGLESGPRYTGTKRASARSCGKCRLEAQTKYAKSGDVHIAYRIFGDGPRDIALVPGTVSHVELYGELPTNEYLLKRLTSFARVIVFDQRGQGLSEEMEIAEISGLSRA